MKKKGFTLIELLVVIAIIGLLSTMAIVSLSGARAKARDARRAGDVKQIQTALEMYYVDSDGYPIEATAVILGSAGFEKLCDKDAGGTGVGGWVAEATACTATYMGLVPTNPLPAATGTGIANYSYTSANGSTYSIIFGLEGKTGGLTCPAGKNCECTANPDGITCKNSTP